MRFTTEIHLNEMSENHYIIVFTENLLLWQPYTAVRCIPKSKATCIVLENRSVKSSQTPIIHAIRADGRKNLLSTIAFLIFFPLTEFKIGIDTHPIDFS